MNTFADRIEAHVFESGLRKTAQQYQYVIQRIQHSGLIASDDRQSMLAYHNPITGVLEQFDKETHADVISSLETELMPMLKTASMDLAEYLGIDAEGLSHKDLSSISSRAVNMLMGYELPL